MSTRTRSDLRVKKNVLASLSYNRSGGYASSYESELGPWRIGIDRKLLGILSKRTPACCFLQPVSAFGQELARHSPTLPLQRQPKTKNTTGSRRFESQTEHLPPFKKDYQSVSPRALSQSDCPVRSHLSCALSSTPPLLPGYQAGLVAFCTWVRPET